MNKIDADNSIHCTRTADVGSLPHAAPARPSCGGIAAYRQQIDLMLADAEKEYQACRRVNLKEEIAAQSRIETLRAVRESANIHLLRGGV